MKKNNRLIIIISLMLCLCLLFGACENGSEPIDPDPIDPTPVDPVENTSNYSGLSKRSTDFFSTETILVVYDNFRLASNVNKFNEVWVQIKATLAELEKQISVVIEDSDIAKFNALGYNESVSISKNTAEIIKIAKEVYELTNGSYDPTVYNSVDLWGFTPRFNSAYYSPTAPYDRERYQGGFYLPSQEYIEAFKSISDFSLVELSGNDTDGYILTKKCKGVVVDGVTYNLQLDLGGIGKGYAVDVVQQILNDNGYKYGYFSCGGSSMSVMKYLYTAEGAYEKDQYGIGLRKPRFPKDELEEKFLKTFFKDMTLSTSGDYEHSYVLDGLRYCHIVDPSTGYPINVNGSSAQKGICTVSVFGGGAAYNDALTTALCVMGLDNALELLNSGAIERKYVITLYDDASDHCELVTNMQAKEYQIFDTDFVLASEIVDGKVIYLGEFLK